MRFLEGFEPLAAEAGPRNLGFEAGLRATQGVPVPGEHVRLPPISRDKLEDQLKRSTVSRPEEPQGAQARYTARIEQFEKDGRPLPRLRHRALWLLHNCIAHPLLALAGERVATVAVEFHELTSQWLNHREPGTRPTRPREPIIQARVIQFEMPKVENPGMWMLHNLVSHPAIGLWPSKVTFDLHDWTAKLMDVPNWV